MRRVLNTPVKSAYDTALSEYNDAVIAFNAAKATYEKDPAT